MAKHFGRTMSIPALALTLLGCASPEPGIEEIVADAQALGAAYEQTDTAIRDLARDLEDWGARAGRPTSAEELLLPMMLRQGFLHRETEFVPEGADPLAVEYSRFEVRQAEIQRERARIEGAWLDVLDRFRGWADATGAAVRRDSASFPTPLVSPGIDSDLRIAGTGTVAQRQLSCPLVTPTFIGDVLVELCVVVEIRCQPADEDEPLDEIDEESFWSTVCIEECIEIPNVGQPNVMGPWDGQGAVLARSGSGR